MSREYKLLSIIESQLTIITDQLNRIDELEKQIDRIDKAYSMRATDVWLTHNMNPHDYLCKEISEALYGTGE